MDEYNIDGHKMLHHLRRVVDWQEGKNVYPLYVEISPVGHCNHRCSFCAVDYLGYKKTFLDVEKLERAIFSMAVHEVKSIMYAGEGEPTLHPRLSDIIHYTKRQGIDVALTTNGSGMNEDFCLGALKHCTWVKVSINAGNAMTYALVHGCPESQWALVWKNVKRAVEYKKKEGLETAIGVQCVLLPENAHTLQELAFTCREVGVDYLVIKPFCQNGLSVNKQYDDLMYNQSYDKYLNALNMYANSTFELITRQSAIQSWNEKKRQYQRCLSVPHFWAYIQSNGDMYGCSAYIGDDRFKYGNINEMAFHEIWNSRPLDCPANLEKCRINCRMDKVNQFLWDISIPVKHQNFI